MKLSFTTLDVFTTTPFSGNALAIVRVPATHRATLTEDQKQKIATEFNLSETVFLHEVGPSDTVANYDIFTARSRVSFAGRVTSLRTLAGLIPLHASAAATASVNLPHDLREHTARLPHPLPSASTNPSGSGSVPLVSIVKGMAFNLVPLSTLPALASVSAGLVPAADVFACRHLDAGSGWDVGLTGTFYYVDLGADPECAGRRLLRTRSIGSREDPGTGSASGALCSYLALQEGPEKGRGPFEFHLVQGVEMGRRCDIFVRVVRKEDGEGVEEVVLSGNAVKVMEGFVNVE
ncbi:Phenazine biosynthesis protein [Neofusicoccum parvum]|nr:Phenazine biosynthesis protein [Neofusicoccum parvum]